ncbi:FtsX-like permease family protein [Nocardioides sp.]|uniref:FtsX-like permease family protein n=1 Tax=Nocardioides sp. TaxID=35761 RepID=UPI002D7ECEDC|nr:FtsX-like permease family protein [Nocardioides sp.]HET8960920.1 FtsX-like permease family protein [Nocardioides sp.]
MAGTILRGLRSRALLTAGSVLLTGLAIGSAVLGPIFQEAVTNSYLVTRLNEAPNTLTGLTWVYPATADQAGDTTAAVAAAEQESARAEGPFAAPQSRLETQRFRSLDFIVDGGLVQVVATPDACEHLALRGECPDAPGEIVMLTGDLDFLNLSIGDRLDLANAVGPVKIVGAYRVPESATDYWFDAERFASSPRDVNDLTGAVKPYQPAPFVTVPETFDELPTSSWSVRVDRRLDAPPDLTPDDLAQAQATAATLEEDTVNDLPLIAREVRTQQETARASIAPAVISLVLVALALLLRLLMAAADLRLPELALASLRGLTRRQLWGLGLSEPLTVLALSLPVGVVLGVGLALGLTRSWLVPGLPLPLPWQSLLAGLLVVVAALGVAGLAVGLVLRVSLSEQLTGVRRPKPSGRVALVAQLALFAGAIAVLAAKLSGGRPGSPDLTDLVLPVLLAVVAGLLATRFIALAATWWTRRRSRSRSLPGFVAARAISRRMEGTLVILPVTAAIAVCVFGAGVYQSAAAWRESVAATTVPADELWLSPRSLDETVALTHELDPEGDYLMAMSTFSTLGPSYTVVDAPRLASVSAWQDQWTPGSGAGEIADDLGLGATVPIVTGRRIGLTVDNQARVGGELSVRLRLDVRGDRSHYLFLGPFPSGTSTRSELAPYCRTGCRLDGLTLGGPATSRVRINGVIEVSDITVDGEPVPGAIDGAGWNVSPNASDAALIRGVETDGGVIRVDTSSGGSEAIAQLSAGDLPTELPVVRGVDAPAEAPPESFGETSSLEFPARAVVTAESVPLQGPSGSMIDYTMLNTDRDTFTQDTPVYILARADTPDSMTQQLRDEGASVSSTLASVKRTLGQGAYALALRLYAVVAVLVLLMALAGLFVSTAVQLPARRRDAASMRVVGVPRRAVMSAVMRELVVVLGATAVAGLAAGTIAQYVVLRTVTLGVVEDIRTPALIAAVDWQRLVLLSAAAALLFGTVALVSAALTVRGARGSTLRESAR